MRKVTKDYNLEVIEPEIVKEWHPKKNKALSPREVFPNANVKVWWLCSEGHEWIASVKGRSNGNGCPYCSGKISM